MTTEIAHDEHHVRHPEPKDYVKIAVVLAVLTVMEVSLYYIEVNVEGIGQRITVPLLLILSGLKFVIVVGWFMHLRFEKSFLAKFFSVGAVLALVLYFIALAALGAVHFFG
ncbi:MAG: cytochrome C oxidase subunit IV family protein [Acidimicrobiia bacterium]|nr:cytochrome C oxidase subunit IV family protein [Acidimicrobiia bacterium]